MDKIFGKIIKIVKDASKIYYKKTFYERNDKHKFTGDDVTNRDIEVQQFIKQRLTKLIPDLGIIGEEGDSVEGKRFCLVVDPIDGTFNYKHNILSFGTQVCLLEDGETIFSCQYIPFSNDLFYSFDNKSYANSKEIGVSEEKDLDEMVVAFGDYQVGKDIIKQKKVMAELASNVKRVRMFGSSCVDSCLLASGGVDVYIIFTDNVWDIMPGEFLIQNAGGVHFTNTNKNIQIYGNNKNVLKIANLLKDIEAFSLVK